MIWALLLQAAPLPTPPADWDALPALPLGGRARGYDPSPFVRREVLAGRCKPATPGRIDSPAAVYVGPGGDVQRIVPRAIGCPTVEQFTAGYVSTMARGASGLRPGWYRVALTYRWAQ